MIERVARALAMNMVVEGDAWDLFDEVEQHAFLGEARVAIEAMREPSIKMQMAYGERYPFAEITFVQIAEDYTAMIDAALSEGEDNE